MEKVIEMQEREIERLKSGINEILGRFKLFGKYTIEDYEKAMGDLAEIVG